MTGLDKNKSIPLILLAGGKGTRLQAVEPNRPKPMVLVKGKPFLHWLVQHYYDLGHRTFIGSTGYMAEQIEQYSWSKHFPNATFKFYREKSPLGTGGAIQAIYQHFSDLDQTWVINADTLLPAPLPVPSPQLEALYTALEKSEVFDATPNLVIEGKFVVGESKNAQYFDGGAVFVTRAAVSRYNGKIPCSMHELLAPTMALQRVGYSIVAGTCYDIGTAERLKRFEEYVS